MTSSLLRATPFGSGRDCPDPISKGLRLDLEDQFMPGIQGKSMSLNDEDGWGSEQARLASAGVGQS
jgi:hypothetical protein